MSPMVTTVKLVAVNPDRYSLGLAYLEAHLAAKLAAAVRVEQHLWDLSQVQRREVDLAAMASEIVAGRPEVIALSWYCWNHRLMQDLAAIVQRLSPGAQLVVGGPEAGTVDENALLAFPEGTVFVVGEGESALTAIVDQAARAVPADAPIEGTVFCGHAGLVRSARPAQSIPPEALPSPILSRTLRPASTDWIPSYATTRGCVFNCSFCAWQDGFREREFPLDQVFAELDVLAGEGHDRIWITDTIFGRNAERGAAILRRIQDWPGSTRFALELHAHYLPDVLVDEIARVPLAWAAVGIQSLAPDVLRLTRRSPHTGRLLDAVGRLYDRLPDRSALHLDVICGLPGQTAEDCFQTVDLLLEQFPEATIFTGMLQILPGTSLERLRGEPGWVVLPPEADGEVLLTPHIDAADMRRIRDLLVGLDAYSLARPTGQRAVTAASLEALGRGLRGTRFAAHPLYGRRERFATSGADGFPDTDD